MFDYISLTNLSDEYLIFLVLIFFNINNPYYESPHMITMLLQENLNA